MTDITLDGARPTAVLPPGLIAPAPPSGTRSRWSLFTDPPAAVRIGIVLALGAMAYFFVFAHIVADALAGSRAAILVVVPLLVLVAAAGDRGPVRGVADSESDWIVAALFGVGCFAGIHLLTARMPTLSGLWRLDLLGAVVWFVCSWAILFGVRHALQRWKVWLFALCCATPLPFLLAAAAIGGSDSATAILAAAVGALTVLLAGRTAPLAPRLMVAAGAFGIAVATVLAIGDDTSLLVRVLVGAGAIPVLAIVVLNRAYRATGPTAALPRCAPPSLVVLVVAAAVLGVLNHPSDRPPAPPLVSADWAERAALHTPTSFGHITRFLGPDATLTRFAVAGSTGSPGAAVDVMSTPGRGALDDFADAVWYPTSRPVNYRPAEPSAGFPPGARVVHSNADIAMHSASEDWYAVTWTWRTEHAHQRVTVIVSQVLDRLVAPPAPGPLSVLETSVQPALWIARQQPHSTGEVDPLVVQRADDLVRLLTESSTGA